MQNQEDKVSIKQFLQELNICSIWPTALYWPYRKSKNELHQDTVCQGWSSGLAFNTLMMNWYCVEILLVWHQRPWTILVPLHQRWKSNLGALFLRTRQYECRSRFNILIVNDQTTPQSWVCYMPHYDVCPGLWQIPRKSWTSTSERSILKQQSSCADLRGTFNIC